MLDHYFSKEIFPNVQTKPLLTQLEAISSRPITSHLGEETNIHLATTSFQVVVESNKVSPQPPLLQTKQSQVPQPLLIRLVLQTLHQLRCPSLDMLQHLNVFLALRDPKLNKVFEVWLHQCKYKGMITSIVLLATLFLIKARMLLAFLATWAHCWLISSSPNLIQLAQAHRSSLSRSLCRASLPSSRLTLLPSLLSSANLLRVHSIPLSRSLIKILKKTGPKTKPWGTPLVTSCQLDLTLFTTSLWAQPSSQLFTQRGVHQHKP
ncbi:hypothetical protein QYF61_022809 [Mycteria americana]|uniref:Uncharacterized protein n=1 Tax=Mycteria americana TaxID=33587 RepID=A0AAN7S4C0_MYCAM|nr:hypothetical protein QYF61_022809 [Mycteria americana]